MPFLKRKAVIFREQMDFAPNPKVVCCDSTLGSAQGSTQQLYLLLTFQASLNLLEHMAQLAEKLVWRANLVAEPSLVLSTTRNLQCFWSISKWLSITTKGGMCFFQNPKGSNKVLYLFFGLGEDWWDLGLIPGLGRSHGGGHSNPLWYSCLENLHGQSLVGYSPWGHKELDTTKQLSTLKAAGLTWQVLMYCCCWCITTLYTNREIFKCPKHQTPSK